MGNNKDDQLKIKMEALSKEYLKVLNSLQITLKDSKSQSSNELIKMLEKIGNIESYTPGDKDVDIMGQQSLLVDDSLESLQKHIEDILSLRDL